MEKEYSLEEPELGLTTKETEKGRTDVEFHKHSHRA
jgi:hypothetical protein